MKKLLLYALMGAFAVAGVAETAPPATAGEADAAAPRSLEQLRAKVRTEAMSELEAGDLQTVAQRRYHRRVVTRHRTTSRRRYARRRYTSRFSLRYIHRRGHWCSRGKWYGRRCKYTPRLLKPLRQR